MWYMRTCICLEEIVERYLDRSGWVLGLYFISKDRKKLFVSHIDNDLLFPELLLLLLLI